MNEKELVIWAAGFFDGEGTTHCGRIKHGPSPRYTRGHLEYVLKLGVQQGTRGAGPPDTLLRLQTVFGGSISVTRQDPRNLNGKKVYGWAASAQKGRRALAQMLPFLGEEKQDQADRARVRCHDGRALQSQRLLANVGFAARGEKNGWSKLTEEQVRELRRRYAAGERPVDLAPAFGITASYVSRIALGRTWGHLATEAEIDRDADR